MSIRDAIAAWLRKRGFAKPDGDNDFYAADELVKYLTKIGFTITPDSVPNSMSQP